MERLEEVYYDRGRHNVEEQAGAFMERRLTWPTPDANVMNEDESQETFYARRELLKAKGYNGNGADVPLTIASTGWCFRSLPPARPTPAGLPFSVRVRILLRLCRLLRKLLPSPYRRPGSIFRKKLNPDFTDLLMGWLVGWSSAGRVFSAVEMESYLCRQRRLLQFLLDG